MVGRRAAPEGEPAYPGRVRHEVRVPHEVVPRFPAGPRPARTGCPRRRWVRLRARRALSPRAADAPVPRDVARLIRTVARRACRLVAWADRMVAGQAGEARTVDVRVRPDLPAARPVRVGPRADGRVWPDRRTDVPAWAEPMGIRVAGRWARTARHATACPEPTATHVTVWRVPTAGPPDRAVVVAGPRVCPRVARTAARPERSAHPVAAARTVIRSPPWALAPAARAVSPRACPAAARTPRGVLWAAPVARQAPTARRGHPVAPLFPAVVRTGSTALHGQWVVLRFPVVVRRVRTALTVRRGRWAAQLCPAVVRRGRMVRRGRWAGRLFPVVVRQGRTVLTVRRGRWAVQPCPAVGPAMAWPPVDRERAPTVRVLPVVARLCRVAVGPAPTVGRQPVR
ncbi:hypothetical protein Axi01nite_42240 [Actinoplanes xinjiangensis]|nr:hypothetical protein Axi01nite_42240 [Actinoplanes xinjiangensis]